MTRIELALSAWERGWPGRWLRDPAAGAIEALDRLHGNREAMRALREAYRREDPEWLAAADALTPLVRELAVDGVPVAVTCRVLGFSRQAFYAWDANPVSNRGRAPGERHPRRPRR